jgi:hypothetical protein
MALANRVLLGTNTLSRECLFERVLSSFFPPGWPAAEEEADILISVTNVLRDGQESTTPALFVEQLFQKLALSVQYNQ